MKSFKYAFLAAAACGMASAAETAYTNPVGYTTTTLVQGYNNVGITVHPATKAVGTLDVIASGSVQDTSVGIDFTASLGTTGVLHVLEITSGAALGLVTEISTWTTNTITTVDNLVTAGVLSGDSYRIRKAPTLEEIFTTNTVDGPLTAGTASTADLIYVPTGSPGVYTQYFLNSTGSFRKVSPAGAAPNTPVVYLDGLFVQRKASGTKNLVISGEIKPEKTLGSLVTGFNYLGTVYPTGSTLQNSGLDSYVLKGTASTADLVYIPTGTPGVYTVVFLNSTNVWRTVSPAGVAPTINFTGAIFIERKGGATSYGISAPSTWQLQ